MPKHKVPRFRRAGRLLKCHGNGTNREMMPMMMSGGLVGGYPRIGAATGPPDAPRLPAMTTCVGPCSWLIYTLNLRHNFIYKLLFPGPAESCLAVGLLRDLLWVLLRLVGPRLRFAAFSVYETKAEIYCAPRTAARGLRLAKFIGARRATTTAGSSGPRLRSGLQGATPR